MNTAFRVPRGRVVSRWPAFFAALLVVGCLLSAAAPSLARERVGFATKRLQVWSERDTRATVVLTVPRDTEITVTGRARQGFYPVQIDDIEGWALTGTIAIAVDGAGNRQRAANQPSSASQPSNAGTQRGAARTLRGFATEPVNLRDGPSTRDRSQGVIPAGREVTLTGEERDGFVGVAFDGTTGWIAREYVDTERPLTGGAEPTPALDPTPVLRGNPRQMPPVDIIPFIYAAADYYGQPREDMLRVAQCESDLVPMAVNAEGGSYGIFQFKTGTWLSTPYAEYDIFDPRASAYAAGWMWSVGRRNEWVCQ